MKHPDVWADSATRFDIGGEADPLVIRQAVSDIAGRDLSGVRGVPPTGMEVLVVDADGDEALLRREEEIDALVGTEQMRLAAQLATGGDVAVRIQVGVWIQLCCDV